MTETTTINTNVSNPRFLSGSRIKTIFVLAVPILATMLSANLMGVIDTAMIGQLGDAALASVSVASNLFFMTFSLIMGIAAGVQILVARRLGQGDAIGAPAILNAGLVAGAAGGVILVVLGYCILPFAASLINSDATVVSYAQD